MNQEKPKNWSGKMSLRMVIGEFSKKSFWGIFVGKPLKRQVLGRG